VELCTAPCLAKTIVRDSNSFELAIWR